MDDLAAFMKVILKRDFDNARYRVETADGSRAVNAKSYIGMMYMSAEHSGEMYLVNETDNGVFPTELDRFRAM